MSKLSDPTIEAGELRHRVDLQVVTKSKDSYGQPVEIWGTVATLWANVMDVGGMEVWQAQQVSPESDGVIVLRYRPDVTAENRFLFGTRVLNVSRAGDVGGLKTKLVVEFKERVGVTA